MPSNYEALTDIFFIHLKQKIAPEIPALNEFKTAYKDIIATYIIPVDVCTLAATIQSKKTVAFSYEYPANTRHWPA